MTGRVKVGAVDVAYGTDGDVASDAIVFVHGTTGNRLTWAAQSSALSSEWHVVLPEFAGSGETRDPGGILQLDDLVAQVLGAAGAAGADRFHLAGFSLGAVVAAALAADHPDRVRSLALVAGWAKSDGHIRFTMDLWQRLFDADPELFARYALADGFSPAFVSTMADAFLGADGLGATLAAGTARQSELNQRIDISSRLAHITAPTLVVGGTHDRFIPVGHSHQLAAGIRGARLVEIDSGHVIPVERAEELTGLLRGFFSEVPA